MYIYVYKSCPIYIYTYIYIYIYICWARFLKEKNIKEKLIHLPGRRNVLGKFKEVATRLSGVITRKHLILLFYLKWTEFTRNSKFVPILFGSPGT